MSLKLTVPPERIKALTSFVSYSPEELAALFEALRAESPSLHLNELSNVVAEKTGMTRESVYETLSLLASLSAARESFGSNVDEFIRDLRTAMEELDDPQLKKSDWGNFQRYLAEALGSDTALSVTGKAASVMTDQAHVYCYGRVLTDMRPIFRNNVEDGPAAFVAVHTLKLAYHENFARPRKEFFVALDRTDVEELIALLQRALTKEDSLKKVSLATGLPLLEAK